MNEQTLKQHFLAQLDATGLVAILRGIRPNEVRAIGTTLYKTGFRLIEIPLNSPNPLRSIEHLVAELPPDTLVGAGTVMTPTQVANVHAAGGRLIVMPHSDPQVIRAAADANLIVLPGVATPTEAFAALAAGATSLKAFPAELLTPTIVKAWRAVLPHDIRLLPVGGITPDKLQAYLEAGASGFGLGGALYRPGDTAEKVRQNAQAFMSKWQQVRK
ncbi:MAG: 2-dehydro-3-deoxy-6-phosphogalactonate aldolase [Castellaniella sp.]|uniref:2-dehydro-3-deoxy-6-phosphogalactonate aldolase n=1 Tax=Castellaniella sp. TaxID=1955812 RepID=UPI00122AF716|nr:2-dehydro-3-deoxy-6-phosphogalactonate aldolase [Castellaniella sp.]TAN30825.1 MAG: 2-dehydro-3-deoxy-6-phosphogalactonate aldolase [Castellaniella sp.]